MAPKIKLRLNAGAAAASPLVGSPSAASPSAAGQRLKIKFGGAFKSIDASASNSSETSPQKLKKSGRAIKPTAKASAAANKRGIEENDDLLIESPKKKTKLTFFRKPQHTSTTKITLKSKGKPPKRPGREGYDSEASDQEKDPSVEEGFIMHWSLEDIAKSSPGWDASEDVKYIAQMIEERKIGAGAQISFRAFGPDGRRLMITVRENSYAAVLVDIPTIIEGMKTWDRKNLYKSVDICQMLHVFSKVSDHSEARVAELPKEVDPETWDFPHGLTPPMRYARHRRFRKRTRRTRIEYVEKEVEKLLAKDEQAESTAIEWVVEEAASRGGSHAVSDEGNRGFDPPSQVGGEYEDADGEPDEDVNNGEVDEYEDMEIDIAADIEAALLLDEGGTPATDAATPLLDVEVGTPVADEVDFGEDVGDEEDDEEDDEDEDEDEEDGGEEPKVVDEAENKKKEQREEIKDLEAKLAEHETKFEFMDIPYLKTRLAATIRNLKQALANQKAALGEDDDDNYGPS